MAQLHPVSALLRNDLALTVHSRRYFTPVVWRGELHSLKRPGSLFSNTVCIQIHQFTFMFFVLKIPSDE